jgi:hypothetical protein
VKPSYILKVTYSIAAVMAMIHSPAVARRAPRSMVLAVCDREFLDSNNEIYLTSFKQITV